MKSFYPFLHRLLLISLFSGNAHAHSPLIDAEYVQGKTCLDLYRDPNIKKPSERDLKIHGISFTIGSLGLITSVAATALTAGAATPGTLALGAASIGLMTGGVGVEGYLMADPASQVIHNQEMAQVLNAADIFTQNPGHPGTARFVRFYEKHIKKQNPDPETGSMLSTIPSLANAAGLLSYFNQKHQKMLCETGPFQGGIHFRFLTKKELVQNMIASFNEH